MLNSRVAIATLVLAFVTVGVGVAADETPTKQVTLMGMLQEWIYPDAKFNGAQSSDAAVSNNSAIKSKAVLTTPDSAEEVMEFYCKKLNVNKEGKNLDEKEGERITTNRSVLIQRVPDNQVLHFCVIAVNSPKSSTTLVISRAEESGVTRIAWSNYRQLWP
jgi:hypothetical protein